MGKKCILSYLSVYEIEANIIQCRYHLASASADNSVKIWDIRTLRNLYTISAHQSLVSDVKYSKGVPGTNNNSPADPNNIAGLYLTTSGYDGSVRIWSGDDFRLIRSLDGHDGKVMGVDISRGKETRVKSLFCYSSVF